MNSLSQSVFRDAEDLDQATRFLHENGMLCYYIQSFDPLHFHLKVQLICIPHYLCLNIHV